MDRDSHHPIRAHTQTKPELFSSRTEESVLRRASHEDQSKARKFLINVAETKQLILDREDTDNNFQITVDDLGPKTLALGTADSGGYRKLGIRGNYMLSNLLQELAYAEDYGRKYIVLDEARLNENPVRRLSRMIRNTFWHNLTRCMDADGLELTCADTKDRTATTDSRPRIYIPAGEEAIFQYYQAAKAERPRLQHLQVEYLPKVITPEFVRDINNRPGILALAMKPIAAKTSADESPSPTSALRALPYIVPGGRFNEMYGWDSYFSALGLLQDGYIDLAKNMCEHFAFEIKHYGKILNANRSYYLCRSQPPFLTDMALRVYAHLNDQDLGTSSLSVPCEEGEYDGSEIAQDADQDNETNEDWLRRMLQSAIKEYHQVWMSPPRLDPMTQLSKYCPDGLGIPPETEPSHFDNLISKYAEQAGLSIVDFDYKYTQSLIKEPELDAYFLHDRAVRESGHDTTYRLDGVCANLATVDLNTLLYKYEVDIAHAIDDLLGGHLVDMDGHQQTSSEWLERAEARKQRINKYLWHPGDSLYYDYDTVKKKQTTYESATAFWALWSGCASNEQAEALATRSLFKFENKGGLVSGTEKSRGTISVDRPNRQWDFPFGWAPHQILAWEGFANYGMVDIASRLAYRWLFMITKSFVEFNGVVPEKYDVVSLSHKVEVEYGNQGLEFKYVPREGFGWMNASYQVGLTYMTRKMKSALATLADPDDLFTCALEREQRSRPVSVRIQAIDYRRKSFLAMEELADQLHDTVITKISSRNPSPRPSEDLFPPTYTLSPPSSSTNLEVPTPHEAVHPCL
ncbi:trehalase-domain-containing protein [Hesseltinella vesiculosa]|uniref:Trehalase n=1 Tax=Hesseltinella vesiculosa TaxID=101127 RepID=A0A1X2GN73_9FUNG|nr:trehalase-domain-containing protein [Hesseltinella vesiculosa]